MIVKLHGTSGSGKTTVAKFLLQQGEVTRLPNLGTRPCGYRVDVPYLDQPLFILGPYETTCGGLDAISSADDHIRLLLEYGPQGHVFYEGLLQSGFYGRIGQASEKFGDQHIFAFLNTPLEVCIERVKARRAERGTTTPFNPANTEDKFQAIARLKWRLENGDGCPKRPTALINYQDANNEVMRLFREP